MKQTTFASAAWDRKGKVTRRERFLSEMDAVIPWDQIQALIEPHYPKAGNGTQPMPLERMLRIYFMQQWFNLSDPGAEDSLYDSESMRRFAQIELVEDAVPDETTILRFRHLLERHHLTEQIFGLVRGLLESKRLLLKSGTIVDATIIDAPPSTKNEAKARDPDFSTSWLPRPTAHAPALTKSLSVCRLTPPVGMRRICGSGPFNALRYAGPPMSAGNSFTMSAPASHAVSTSVGVYAPGMIPLS